MSKKFLGKVVTGAALAGATLLIATPGVAAAGVVDGGKDGHDQGYISTWPRAVKPGHEVKVIQYCLRPQEEAWAWSKPTGKVWLKLKPAPPVPAPASEDGLGDAMREERNDGKYDGKDGWKKDHGYKDGVRPSYPEPTTTAKPSWSKDHEDSWAKDSYKDGVRPEPLWAPEEPADGEKDGVKPTTERWDPQWPADGEKDGVEPMAERWAKKPIDRGVKDGVDMAAPEQAEPTWGLDGEKDGVEPMAERWAKKPIDRGVKDGVDMAAPEQAEPTWLRDGEKDGMQPVHYVYWGKADVSWKVKPGRYALKGSCADGKLYVVPKGWVDGGDGGTSAPNTGLAVGGAGALAAAGLGGLVMMRRRRTDGSVA